MKFKVLISDSFAEEGIKILRKEKRIKVDVDTNLSPAELKERIRDYDALILRSGTKVTKEIIKAAGKLKIIGRAGVGLDNVDIEAASKQGIIVMNAPGGNTISTAEHTMSMILALSRNIPQADLSVKANKWERKKFMGVELYGKKLGIIGLGRIGSEVAKRALSFGMKVCAYDPYLSRDKAKRLDIELLDFKELLKQVDYISIHTPLTDDTRHLLGDKEFKLMKKGVRLINCARGGMIDEESLRRALAKGKISGVALDVFEVEPPKNSPLLKFDNVIVTPHLGASTKEAQTNVAVDIARQVCDGLLERGIRCAVNVPCVEPEVFKLVEPYIKLAENIGSLQTQLVKGRINKVLVNYSGDVIHYQTESITIALVKGLLTPIVGETVNFVNASLIARERGIKVIESKMSEAEDFANLITVLVETDKEKSSISGTLFTKNNPRIVKINEFYVEIIPSGYMIIISNIDVPGIIGQIGSILGENNINIASMTFGRKKPGGRAVSVLSVDGVVPANILAQIRKAKNILDVKLIKL